MERPESASVVVRNATRADHPAICVLNDADVQQTSPMDIVRLAKLASLSCYHKVACIDARVVAFVLAIRRGAPYENQNFDWFSRSYPDFLYIDRIVVAAESRGLKLASLLYSDLFGYARGNDIPLVTCEYNLVPPNEPSQRFHAGFGFTEQGTQWVDNGAKQVSLQVAPT